MSLDSLKLVLQRHLSDGLVTIVGSGLSCAEGLPGMEALGNHLNEVVTKKLTGDDLRLWDEIKSRIAVIGLEAALLETAPTANIQTAVSAATASYVQSHELTVVAKVFSGERVLRFSRLLPHLLKPPSGIPVICTNYDRLVEIAAEEAGLGVDTMFVGQFAGELDERKSALSFCCDAKLQKGTIRLRHRDRVIMFKPHGSLDWYQRAGRPVRYAGDLPGTPRLIVPPGRNKFRTGYDSPYDLHREKANNAIDRASRLLIIGYGFNDDHLETHLTPRIRNGCPTLILTRTLSENANVLASRYANVIALQHHVNGDGPGTLATLNRTDEWHPGSAMWDLGAFVSEVLEP